MRISILALPSFLLVCYVEGIISAMIIILAALLHEAGHLVAMTACRAEITEIALEPMGARITYDGIRTSYVDDLRIALAGPLFNLLFCLLGVTVFVFFKNEYVLLFVFSHLALAAANLLPVSFLDGGNMLYAALCIKSDQTRAEKVCRVMNVFGRLIMLAANIFALVLSGFNVGFCVLLTLQAVTLLSE